MNLPLVSLEISVVAIGLVVLLADLWLPPESRRLLGYAAAAALGLLFLNTFTGHCSCALVGQSAFGGMFVQDALSVFFKRFFLLAGALVLVLAVEFSDRIAVGVAEYYSLMVLALAGMLFAASANDFALLFVSVELIAVSFYVLTSFQRGQLRSLEAGVKYLILGAVASAFLVYGVALLWGTTGRFNLDELAMRAGQFADSKPFVLGGVLVFAGLGFKIAAVPLQMWTPDVYQGAPTPTTAFLAVGSKAAGLVLLLRVLFTVAPDASARGATLLMWVAAGTILYGNLCALPQRNLKRLLGYSSIAQAGYLLLGVAALSEAGRAAVLFYLAAYLFTVIAAFTVIVVALRQLDDEDISGLAGLHRRSPFLAATMSLAMASLAGIPPLAGFFGKFLLFQAVIERGAVRPGYYVLALTALAGVVISLYYYLGVVREIYWAKEAAERSPIRLSRPVAWVLALCVGGMLWLGVCPGTVLDLAREAARCL